MALALAASVLGAVPTALRTPASALDALLCASAVLSCLVVPGALLRTRAIRGYRSVLGRQPPRLLGVGLALWAGLATSLLAVFAAVLKATTNHRALGGATFGVAGLGLALGAAVVAGRLVRLATRLLERGASRRVVLGSLAALTLLPCALVAVPLLGANASPTERFARTAVSDALLFAALAGLALALRLPAVLVRAARVLAVPLAVFLVIAGFARLERAGRAVSEGGGLAGAIVSALEAWTDRDGDGFGAHFGGRDCDDGDARRHPGAEEIAGDGLDNDCDGWMQPTALAELPSPPPSATGSAAAPAEAGANAPAPAHPDVVLVTLDTVRADHTSAYGYAKATTPALAALAQRGTAFEHAYATGSDTQRALVPLVSGRTFAETALGGGDWPIVKSEVETLAERMSKAGYQTAAVTSFTWLRQDRGFDQGFDQFDEEPFRSEHPERGITGQIALAGAARAYERMKADARPLFLWVHLFDAHEKYLPHEGIDFGRGEEARYDGEIAFVDRQLAALVALVDDGPRRDRTLWIVHGSQGEAFGEHERKGHGGELFEEMIRVPLVIVAPGAPAGQRPLRSAVSNLDIAATILDFADANADQTSGVSLRAVVGGEVERERAPVLTATHRRVAVIDWPLKLVVRRGQKRDRLVLFDLAADPREARDIAADRPADLQRLDAVRRGDRVPDGG